MRNGNFAIQAEIVWPNGPVVLVDELLHLLLERFPDDASTLKEPIDVRRVVLVDIRADVGWHRLLGRAPRTLR